jgi:hypothetical protein
MAIVKNVAVVAGLYYFGGSIPLTLYGLYKFLGCDKTKEITRSLEIVSELVARVLE